VEELREYHKIQINTFRPQKLLAAKTMPVDYRNAVLLLNKCKAEAFIKNK